MYFRNVDKNFKKHTKSSPPAFCSSVPSKVKVKLELNSLLDRYIGKGPVYPRPCVTEVVTVKG